MGGAELGVASCFFGHSQLLTEASQEAVKFKRTVPFMLTKSMTMKTLGEAGGHVLFVEAGGRIGGPRARQASSQMATPIPGRPSGTLNPFLKVGQALSSLPSSSTHRPSS